MVLALQDSGHFLLLPISDLCKCEPAAYLQNEAVKQRLSVLLRLAQAMEVFDPQNPKVSEGCQKDSGLLKLR
jgi:hypothetical protein